MISRKQFEARFTYSLDDEKINYVEANDILDTLNVNDRYKNIEEKLEKLEILIYKIWEDEHGDEMMKAYNEITLFFTDRTSKQKNIINTQETLKKYYFVHADNTHSEKENDNTHIGKGTRIHDNKSNDKPLDNVPEACKFKDCKFKTKTIKKSKIRQRMRAHINSQHGSTVMDDTIIAEITTETPEPGIRSSSNVPDLVGDTEPGTGTRSSYRQEGDEDILDLIVGDT